MSSIRQREMYRAASEVCVRMGCKSCVRCTLDHRFSVYCSCEQCAGMRRLMYIGHGHFRRR